MGVFNTLPNLTRFVSDTERERADAGGLWEAFRTGVFWGWPVRLDPEGRQVRGIGRPFEGFEILNQASPLTG